MIIKKEENINTKSALGAEVIFTTAPKILNAKAIKNSMLMYLYFIFPKLMAIFWFMLFLNSSQL